MILAIRKELKEERDRSGLIARYTPRAIGIAIEVYINVKIVSVASEITGITAVTISKWVDKYYFPKYIPAEKRVLITMESKANDNE